jgi:hypothetical protein
MELAIANVPAIEGQIVVCSDVSGSMKSPVTGHPRRLDNHRAVHRCRSSGCVIGVAEESIRDGLAVRTGGCFRGSEGARERDDERWAARIDRRWWNELQRSGSSSESAEG